MAQQTVLCLEQLLVIGRYSQIRVSKQNNGIEFVYDNSGVAGIVYNNVTEKIFLNLLLTK